MSDPFLLGASGLTPTGAGIYMLLAVIAGGLLKTWPVLTKLANEARATKAAQAHSEAEDCRARIDALEKRVSASEQRAIDMEGRFKLVVAAYRMVVSELHRKEPKNVVIMHAQALLSPEMAADLPMDEATQ